MRYVDLMFAKIVPTAEKLQSYNIHPISKNAFNIYILSILEDIESFNSAKADIYTTAKGLLVFTHCKSREQHY